MTLPGPSHDHQDTQIRPSQDPPATIEIRRFDPPRTLPETVKTGPPVPTAPNPLVNSEHGFGGPDHSQKTKPTPLKWIQNQGSEKVNYSEKFSRFLEIINFFGPPYSILETGGRSGILKTVRAPDFSQKVVDFGVRG